jgi:hypothetical protein
MNIRGKNVNIIDGDASPSTTDVSDFGRQLTTAGTVSKSFIIQNTGASNLNLTGSPRVVIGGANAADFTVSIQPSTPVIPGCTTTFTIVFNPSAAGIRSATVSMANNDATENPYNFSIQGTGFASNLVRWVNNQGAVRPATVILDGITYTTAATTYTTVQSGIDAAVTDDIVYVTNGVYRNTFETTSTNCSLFGTGQDLNLYHNVQNKTITITSATGNYSTSSARLVGFGFNLRTANNTTIQGLHIDSVRVDAFWNSNCCTHDPSINVKIKNNKISNTRGHGIKTDDGGPTGNSINRGAWEITGNFFENIGFYNGYGNCLTPEPVTAIWLAEPGANFLIADNTISNTKWAGILCTGYGGDPEGQSPAFITYDGVITISGNNVNNTVDAGIQIGFPLAVFYHPANALITGNIITNANTSNKIGIGAITLLANNIRGVSITNNDVSTSFNGLAIEIAGWENSLDMKLINNNNFYNLSGGYGVTHIAGIAPNGLFGTADNLALYNFENNYWGAASGPTYATNPGGTGAGLFKETTLRGTSPTPAGIVYSVNDFDFTPFLASPAALNPISTCPLFSLPVHLHYFKGQDKGNYNLLTWATATETNNDRFEIERSSDANSFEKIGEVKGAGTSYSVSHYEFKDVTPLIAINYYRLKQIDTDGKYKYSTTIVLENERSKTLSIFPNPVTDKIYLNSSENGAYRISNMQGQILQAGDLKSGQPILLRNLPQGIYYLHFNYQIAKFIKL